MLKVAFADFPGRFDAGANLFLEALVTCLETSVVAQEKADLLFYSDFGERHWRFGGLKVYVTGENMLPDFDQCDLAFTPLAVADDWRAVRLPYYAQVLRGMGDLIRPEDYAPDPDRARFCSFVVSNPRGPERNAFFRRLNRRRRVDSGGRHFNNTGGAVGDKMALLRECRFNLAFENSRSPGYITEKLVEPLLAGCIPIYWGAPDVREDFNPECMVNVSDFRDADDAIEHILSLNEDPERRLRMLKASPFHRNVAPHCTTLEHVRAPLLRLLQGGTRPAARVYRRRRLREHVYGSSVEQSLVSLRCRLEGLLWKMGWGG